MTWKKRKRGQYRCQPEEEIIALLFLLVLLSLSLLRLSCTLCPILSCVRPPDLVMQIERKRGRNEAVKETRKKSEREGKRKMRKKGTGFYHSFIRLPSLFSFPLSPSPSLSGTNNYSFLCHQLEQSTPLSLSLSPSICVYARAFAGFNRN